MEIRIKGSLAVLPVKTMSMKAQKVAEVKDPDDRDYLLIRPSLVKSRFYSTLFPS